MASTLITTLTADNFDSEVLKSNVPVLVDFWAAWCGPCQLLSPVLDALAAEKGDQVKITKVNVDDNRELTSKLGVSAMPTLIFFKNGEEKDRVVGAVNRDVIASKLDALV